MMSSFKLFIAALTVVINSIDANHEIRVENRCNEPIWVGALSTNHPIPENGGFLLQPQQTKSVSVVDRWSGRFWGRTKCNREGKQCQTGDCGRGTQCSGAGGVPPATLAEITFDTTGGNNLDFYDVSLVDGYNLRMSMAPIPGTFRPDSGQYKCANAGCDRDLNEICPQELKKMRDGRVIACNSACNQFNTDQYCCRGQHNKPSTCPSTPFSRQFKNACPRAYSYAYDDQASTYTCSGNSIGRTGYVIKFCA